MAESEGKHVLDFLEDYQNKVHGSYNVPNPSDLSFSVTARSKHFGDVQEETFTVAWQQKVFSLAEIEHYSQYAVQNSELQAKFREMVTAILASGTVPRNHLSTHVHGEQKLMTSEISRDVLSPPQPTESQLARAHSGKRLYTDDHSHSSHSPAADSVNKLESAVRGLNIGRTQIYSIVVCLDDVETELCRICWTAPTCLTVYPDFSPASAPYRIYGKDQHRVIGEYWLKPVFADNSTAVRRSEVDQYAGRANKLFYHEKLAFRVPPPLCRYFVYHGQIESARGFENNNIFLYYTIQLPPGWRAYGDTSSSGDSDSSNSQLTAVTQLCSADPVANFCFPIDVQLIQGCDNCDSLIDSDAPDETRCHAAPAPQWPTLYISVLSQQRWGAVRVEGYCHTRLPPLPGRHQLLLTAWRPFTGVRAELGRFFIGESWPLTEDMSLAIPPKHQSRKLNRNNISTVAVGTVRLLLHCVRQCDSSIASVPDTVHQTAAATTTAADAANDSSMAHVLGAFVRARARLLRAKQTALLKINQ